MSQAVAISTGPSGGADLDEGEEGEETGQRDALPDGVEVFRIEGPVFFGVANELLDTLRRFGKAPKVIIFRMRGVPLLDASGGAVIDDMVRQATSTGIRVILWMYEISRAKF
ncbi:sodium-independent anion transporter [Sphingomonas panacis]|uniref:sodium-independent anion transporter n=1 Tax=Sphingomonas panacis TaxID=1560345 RepID=UPI001F0B672B|nr:sodium-independent anion transporter [Sphingomonas panacis]